MGAAQVAAAPLLQGVDCGLDICCPEQQKRRALNRALDELIEKLFNLQDLNEDGVLEEAELVQLNKKVAMLHYGKDIDKEEVRAKYQELFRSKLDPAGEPVSLKTFRRYILDVLQAIDADKLAQSLILEQWISEADLARYSFQIPSFQSISDLPFLLRMSLGSDPSPRCASAPQQDDTAAGPGTSAAVQTPPVAPAEEDGAAGAGACDKETGRFTFPSRAPSVEGPGAPATPTAPVAVAQEGRRPLRAPPPSESTTAWVSETSGYSGQTWRQDGGGSPL